MQRVIHYCIISGSFGLFPFQMIAIEPMLQKSDKDFRAAGHDLARSVMAWIDGADPAGQQFIVGPKLRESMLKSI